MGTLVNSEDPDEMPHHVAFYQGLQCLLDDKIDLQRKIYFGGLQTVTPHIIYTIDHPDFISASFYACIERPCSSVSNFMEKLISYLRVKLLGLVSDPYLYYKSIKETPVCGHLYFNCLKLKYEVLKLGVWMNDPYLYYNSIKDTPVCGHLDFNCLICSWTHRGST